MPKYANQKTIISKKKIFTSNDTFMQVSNDDWMEAAKTIKQYNAFKLYLYFAKNQPGHNSGFSPAHAQEVLGMGRTSCEDSFKMLVTLGYLKSVKDGVYEFYTSPWQEETASPALAVNETSIAVPSNKVKVITLKQNKTAPAVKEVLTATPEKEEKVNEIPATAVNKEDINEKTALMAEKDLTATATNKIVEKHDIKELGGILSSTSFDVKDGKYIF